MNTQLININKIKLNPNNPRTIKDYKFDKLVKSIKDFPKMLELRPIVVDNEYMVLGGNMRLKACQEAGVKKVFIIKAEDLTDEQKEEFIIKDNINYGDWDLDKISENWDEDVLQDWGFDNNNWNDPNEDDSDYFELDEATTEMRTEVEPPRGGDDKHSVFELVMLYENKLKLTEAINYVREKYNIEKIEDALIEIIRRFEENEKRK